MSGRDNNEPVETPVDLAAVQADDALLDMLSDAGSVPGDTDAELARALLAWRSSMEIEPIAELVSTDTALSVIAAARKPAPRRHPLLGPFAAAAAVLVIAFSGVSLGAKSAEPGDQLWPLTKVLYGDYARSVEAATSVQDKLRDARVALNESRPEQARELLDSAQQQLGEVAESEGRAQLTTQRDQLKEMLDGKKSPPTQQPGQPGQPGPPSSQPPPPTSSTEPSVPPSTSPSPTGTSSEPSVAPTTTSTAPSGSSTPLTPFSGPSDPTPRSSKPTVAAPPEGSAASTTEAPSG